jgi:HD-like signal output (HDOD) protein
MKQILFVDDEQSVLDGLRVSLRRQRRKWSMVFAQGGEAALRELEARPFDVLVTDMRMPHINGATLLKRASEMHPEMVRIVLSGHAEEEAILRTLPVAHQFLNKPCEPGILENIIDRACNIQLLLNNAEIRAKVGSIDALPALPRNYIALNNALADEYANVPDIARIIEQDIGMSAKILQIVNSAFFGLARKLTQIEDAIAYLGLHVMKTLVLSVEVFSTFEKKKIESLMDLEALHRHSLLTARISRRIAPDVETGKDAFAASILHDVGILILATWLPELLQESIETAQASGSPLHLVEQELHGFSHAEVGAYLLGRWGLPYPIIEAVAFHHRPAQVKQNGFDLLSTVHIADVLARESELAQAGETPLPRLDMGYVENLGVADQLSRWHAIADQEAQEPVIGV